MLFNYLKVAFRTLARNRLISFINIFGLGLSMSVGMMVMIRLQDQLSYDNFHPNAGSTYRVLSTYNTNSGERWKMASTALQLNDQLSALKGVTRAVNIYPALNGKMTAAGKEFYVNGAFTNPNFFKVFGFTLATGDPSTALSTPYGIVLSKATAQKYFGKQQALGQVITTGHNRNFTVTGVLNEIPGKSHINFDAFASSIVIPQLEAEKVLPEKSKELHAFDAAYTYVTLAPGYNTKGLTADLNSIAYDLNKNIKDGSISFSLQPITSITPGREYLHNDIGGGGSWTKLYFEIGIALIILVAACFNYTNLSIARSLTRAKEVGIRKISGAKRSQIFSQYIIESVLVSMLSLGFAWVLISQIVKYAPFNDSYEFIPSTFTYNGEFVNWTIAFALFTGLLAGASPAWILSSFTPLRILKNLTTARLFGKVSLQKALIVFQYSLSLTIIIFLLAFYRQFSYMGSADPGFRKDNVLVVPLNGLDEKITTQKLSTIPGVQSISAMSSLFSSHFNGLVMPAWLSIKQDAISLNYYYANTDFVRDMGLSLLAGQNSEDEYKVILNEQAVKALGIKDYENAVGQKFWVNDSTQLEIAAVVKDFKYANAGTPISPLALMRKKNAYSYLYVLVNTTNRKALTDQVKHLLHDATPSQAFDIVWLDNQLEQNNSQKATISLLGYLAFMAMAIASLGLLGLVTYTVQVKEKEISIRKVIGAGSGQLVKMLSQGFIKLIFIAGFIAVPIGFTLSRLFLQNFVDRVSFGIGSVLFCFSILLIIGLTTIISQTYRAATENPAKSLRAE
jgi:putative ABC transport system permease protein